MKLVSKREAAKEKRIGKDVIYHLIRMKKLAEVHLPGRKHPKIDMDELDQVLNERKVYQ